MSISVSAISNYQTKMPLSENAPQNDNAPAFKGMKASLPKDGGKLYNFATIAGVLLMVVLPIAGWVSGCSHIIKEKASDKTEVPANVQDTTAAAFDINA